jgi:cell division protein FtsB
VKQVLAVLLSFALIAILLFSLAGCGADVKAENEKLKAENANLKSGNDKLKLEVQRLREELQKASEKDATINSLTEENAALKKEVEDLKSRTNRKKK